MADLNQAAEKNPVYLLDWRVWAEINYLDSPTEYREYLQTVPIQNSVRRMVSIPCAYKLPSRGRTWILAVITFLAAALISACSVCTLMRLP
jgi:hypothetical protein